MFKICGIFVALLVAIFLDTSLAKRRVFNEIELSPSADCSQTCIPAWRCNAYTYDPVWTIVDGKCRVFMNGCIFGTESCNRINSCLPAMVETEKEICQGYCDSGCETQPTQPVCGWFRLPSTYSDSIEEKLTFTNQCELDKYACSNAKPYISASPGSCI